jgi:hypothetical protein
LFSAMVAVKAIFARMARITSCARRACMNLSPMPWSTGCRCLQDAREHACEYYGSDGCDSFHRFRIAALQNACQKEKERISTTRVLLWHFSPGGDVGNPACERFQKGCRQDCLHHMQA